MRLNRTLMFFGVGATLISLTACGNKDEIKVYRVAKAPVETTSPAPEAASMPASMPALAPMPSAPPEASAPTQKPSGKIPAAWLAQPLSSMRQASFLVKGAKGSEADISLITLNGSAGGTLENVNRWLSQLGQPAITEEQLAKTAQRVRSSVGDVTVVDLKGLPDGGDAAKDGRILAGIASTTEKTFFFKMRGNAELVASQKENFVSWIRTLKVAALEPAPAADLGPMPVGHVTTPGMSGSGAPAAEPTSKKLQWQVPVGWKSVPVTSMRYASFAIAGKDGETADASVIDLPGEAGSDLDNVNRWRGQIGLAPVDAAALQSLIVSAKGKNGDFFTVDMPGPKARTLAAWIRLDGHTWFFKLSGPDRLVVAEKIKFTQFLQSVQFHP